MRFFTNNNADDRIQIFLVFAIGYIVVVEIMSAGAPPRGVTVRLRGQIPPLQETLAGLRVGLLLAVAAIFLLLAANFQSARLALAVLLTIPAVLCGVLLMLCLTGLPLIFHDEIEDLTGGPPPLAGPASSSDAPGLLPLDAMLQRALAERPGEVPLYMAFDNESPLLTVTTGPAADAPEPQMTLLLFDRTNGPSTSIPG